MINNGDLPYTINSAYRRSFMDYRNFLSEDFVSENFFISWINCSEPNAKVFWESFLKNNADKVVVIEEARKMIGLLQFKEDELADEDVASMRANILMAIYEDKERSHQVEDGQEAMHAGSFPCLRWAAIITQ